MNTLHSRKNVQSLQPWYRLGLTMSASGLSALFLPFIRGDISRDGAQFIFNIYIVNFRIAKWYSICWRWRWRCHRWSCISERSHFVACFYFCSSEDLWSGKRDCSAARLWYGFPFAIAGLPVSLYLPSVWILWCSRCRQPDERALTIGHVNCVCTRFQWWFTMIVISIIPTCRPIAITSFSIAFGVGNTFTWTPVEASHFLFGLKNMMITAWDVFVSLRLIYTLFLSISENRSPS